MWRYLIGDTVRFTSLNPYRIKIVGRTKSFINSFGEEVVIENAEKALSIVCEKTNSIVNEYTVAPVFYSESSGYHEWLLEFEKKPDNINVFSNLLDIEIQKINSDYQAKRSKDILLKPLKIITLKKGTFYKWLAKNNKLGGQYKVPRLCNDRFVADEILTVLQQVINK